ncbi:hypothetical protein ABG067_001462 [Albugo candida]
MDEQHNIKSLASLLDIVEFLVRGGEMTRDLCAREVAERSFQCSFDTMILSPHGAAVKLLFAEMIQESCSVTLSERLMQVESDELKEGSVHSCINNAYVLKTGAQKRRACRKKALKQRRKVLMYKVEHGKRFCAVLAQIVSSVKQKESAKLAICIDLVHEIINGAYGVTAQVGHLQQSTISKKQRKRKQRIKKEIDRKMKAHPTPNHMNDIDITRQVARDGNDQSDFLSPPDSNHTLIELKAIPEEQVVR